MGSAEAFNGQHSAAGNERVVKVTEYVEGCGTDHFHCFAVLETEKGNVVVLEELKSGAIKREHNPKDYDYRNSTAKVLRTLDCSRAGTTVQDAVKHHPSE